NVQHQPCQPANRRVPSCCIRPTVLPFSVADSGLFCFMPIGWCWELSSKCDGASRSAPAARDQLDSLGLIAAQPIRMIAEAESADDALGLLVYQCRLSAQNDPLVLVADVHLCRIVIHGSSSPKIDPLFIFLTMD